MYTVHSIINIYTFACMKCFIVHVQTLVFAFIYVYTTVSRHLFPQVHLLSIKNEDPTSTR